jgi:hypothetical protein
MTWYSKLAASHCLRAATSSGFRARTSWINSGSTSLLRSTESVSCALDSPLLKNITSTDVVYSVS